MPAKVKGEQDDATSRRYLLIFTVGVKQECKQSAPDVNGVLVPGCNPQVLDGSSLTCFTATVPSAGGCDPDACERTRRLETVETVEEVEKVEKVEKV